MSVSLAPTELLVFQGSPFCNIDCRYCYLPNRTSRRAITLPIISAACRGLVCYGLLAPRVTVLWHAGEPLVLPKAFYEAAFDSISSILADIVVDFAIQTNGLLLTSEWLSLFRRYGVSLGLSCDGPAEWHDENRVTRDGRGTGTRVINAARLIKDAGLPLKIICVLTPQSLRHPETLFSFFDDLNIDEISFNIIEKEGINVKNPFDYPGVDEDFRRFLTCYTSRSILREPRHRVREFGAGLSFLFGTDPKSFNMEMQPGRIITIDAAGRVGTFSPELHAMHHPEYGELTYASVLNDNWPREFIDSEKLENVVRSINIGIELCSATCSYFGICGGGAPSNKLGEHRTFEAAETLACRFYKKAVAAASIALFETLVAGHCQGTSA
jgi:uncharacterized protein